MAPLVSHVMDLGLAEATTVQQLDAFAAGIQFARAEESFRAEANHAVAVAISEALRAKEEGEQRTILFSLSGHGHFDMQSYIAYQAGKLENYEYPAEELRWRWQACPRWVEPGHFILLPSGFASRFSTRRRDSSGGNVDWYVCCFEEDCTVCLHMEAVVKAKAAPGIELREVPVPVPGPGEVLVRVLAASVCGTDLHIFNWDPWAQGASSRR